MSLKIKFRIDFDDAHAVDAWHQLVREFESALPAQLPAYRCRSAQSRRSGQSIAVRGSATDTADRRADRHRARDPTAHELPDLPPEMMRHAVKMLAPSAIFAMSTELLGTEKLQRVIAAHIEQSLKQESGRIWQVDKFL